MEARILVDGKYYDVDEWQPGRIREGAKPEDVWGLEEVAGRGD
jgi:hypothetical protein